MLFITLNPLSAVLLINRPEDKDSNCENVLPQFSATLEYVAIRSAVLDWPTHSPIYTTFRVFKILVAILAKFFSVYLNY